MGKNLSGFIIIVLSFLLIIEGCTESEKENKANENIQGKTEIKKEKSDSNEQYIKNVKFERNLLDSLGYEGIIQLFQSDDSSIIYPLGKLPKDCPWHYLNSLTVSQFISTNFKSLANKLPKLIQIFSNRCHYIYARKIENNWELGYLLDVFLEDSTASYKIFTGGPPNKLPDTTRLEFNWQIPSMLRELYKVHDGFGDWDGAYILSSKEIGVLSPASSDDDAKQKLGQYFFNDLLVIIDYGSDFEDCFIRNHDQKTSNYLAEWDEDSRTILPKKIDLFSYINDYWENVDEE